MPVNESIGSMWNFLPDILKITIRHTFNFLTLFNFLNTGNYYTNTYWRARLEIPPNKKSEF
jgi:hypothetical protein